MVQNQDSPESVSTPGRVLSSIGTFFTTYLESESSPMASVASDPDDVAALASSSGSPATPASLTLLDLQALVKHLSGQTTQSRPSPLTPRYGGKSTAGAWTGMGAGGEGREPYSNYCMREFDIDIHKNHTAMHPIQDKCKLGLRDRPELLFSLPHESNGNLVVESLRAFEKVAVECGFDGVFDITAHDLSVIKFLQEPGMVDQASVDSWCTQLLTTGVYGPAPSGSGMVAHCLPVCPYDRTNLFWSGEALLNSCTSTLRQDLEHQLPLGDRVGPKVLMALLVIIYRPSQSKIQALRDKLGALDIRKYPAENLTLFCQDASRLVREIKMNFMKGVAVTDLTTTALKGLHHCSDELVRIRIRTISIENDINCFGGAFGNKKADVLQVLREVDDMYRVLVNLESYAPALSKKAPAFPAVAYTGGAATDSKLVVDKQAGGILRKTGVCWDCGASDHIRGASACPGKKPTTSGGTPDSKAKHGFDDATHAIVLGLCKAKLESMPTRENIPDDAEYNVMHQGKIVAMYCRHCGRFSKGASKHYTKDHTGTRSIFPYQAPATPALASVPSVPSETPRVSFAPAVMASLANHDPGIDLANVPPIETAAFLSRQEIDYNLGSTGMPATNPNSHVALPSANLALPSDRDLADSYGYATEGALQLLLNEFGG